MITEEEKQFIISFEGFSATAYKLAGENFYTIGYGTARTYNNGETIKKDDVITKEQATYELVCYYERNVEPIIKQLEGARGQELNTNQKCALCSLLYNCGKSSFLKSKCCKYLCNKQDTEAMKEWDFGIKSVAPTMKKGIIKRRNQEIQLFFGVDNYWV